MALGATRGGVVWLVLREGLNLLVFGLGIGWAAAAGLSRLMTGFLYQVRPIDPATYVLVSLLLLAATATACLIPSARAGGIDPMTALRHE
jgi:ABC-type antimicrobial peptide transport system permease subunit